MADLQDNGARPRRARLTREEMAHARRVTDAWLRRVAGDERLTPAAFRLAYGILQHIDWKTFDGAYMAQPTLAKETHLGERTVRDCLKELERCGHIKGTRRRGATTVYALASNDTPAKTAGLTPAEIAAAPAENAAQPRQKLPQTPAKTADKQDSLTRFINEGAPARGARPVDTVPRARVAEPDALGARRSAWADLTADDPGELDRELGFELEPYPDYDDYRQHHLPAWHEEHEARLAFWEVTHTHGLDVGCYMLDQGAFFIRRLAELEGRAQEVAA